MAWFGDLKNITGNLTGQLSNAANTAASFTRDVLAEGTEEVSDQGTELKIAESKIRELEGLIIAQRSENERLNELNHELTEKAEASELQINTISQQYRNVLQEKQDELVSLKQQQHAMQDMQHSMLAAATTATPSSSAFMTHSTSTSSLSASMVSMDEHDFGDIISSQHEVNRLSNEVSQLRSECDHWKQMASAGNGSGAKFQIGVENRASGNNEEGLQLKTKIKELEHNLTHEIDQSQRELSALQDAHSQKQATLTKRHKQEIEDYTNRIEQLEQLLQAGDTPPTSPPTTPVHSPEIPPTKGAADLQSKVKELQEALKKSQRSFSQLDESCKRLRVELEQVKQVEREKSKTAEILRKQVEALKAEKEKGMQENETLRYVKRDLAGKLDAERQENARLLGECDTARGLTNDGKEEIERIRKDEVTPLQEKLAQMETTMEELRTESHQANTSSTRQELHEARKKFSSGAMHRRTELLKEKQQLVSQMIDNGQQVTEGKVSVAVLKAANVQIGDETSDIIVDIGSPSKENITPDLLQALEEENQHLRHKVDHLETEVRELNESCASLVEDKESCEGLIIKLNKDVDGLKRSNGASRSRSGSDRTLELSVDSETESNARLHASGTTDRIQFRRPRSPSGTSTESERTTGSGQMYASSMAMSENELPDSQVGALESSDNVSFDGEYDDSIMFSGMKQRFPEAALVLQEQSEHFELIRADWDMEKQALEEVVVRMREQLKEKDVELQSLKAQKGLSDIDSQQTELLEEDLETLQDRIEEIEEEMQRLHQEKTSLSQDKKALQIELETLQADLKSKEEASSTLSQELESMKSKLQHAEDAAHRSSQQAQEYKQELQLQKEASLRDDGQRDQLEVDLQLLNQQHQQALNQVLQTRDQMKETIEKLTSENIKIVSDLNHKEDLLRSLEELRTKQDKDFKDLKDELDRRKEEASELRRGRDLEDEELLSLREELLETSTIKKELEGTNMELVLQANESKANVEGLEKELQHVKEQSACMVSLALKEQLESSVADLTNQLDVAVSSGQRKDAELNGLIERIHELEGTLGDMTAEKERLKLACTDTKEKLEGQRHHAEEESKLLRRYEHQIESLKRDKESLHQELRQNKQQYEKTIQELSKSRDLDTSTLQEEHEKLIRLKNTKETEVMRLQSEYEELQADLSGTKDMLNSTLDNHQQLADILKNKEEDIKNLAEENSYFFKAIEESKAKVKQSEDLQEKLQGSEIQLEAATAKNASLSRELQKLRQDLKEQLERSDVETKTLEVITELEGEVHDLQGLLESKEEEASSLQGVVAEKREALARLEEKSTRQETEVEASLLKISNLESEVTALRSELDDKTANLEGVSGNLQESQQQVALSKAEVEKTVETQSTLLREKDAQILDLGTKLADVEEHRKHQEGELIKELNEKNTELSLLSDKVEKIRQELDSRQRNMGEMKAEHNFVVKQKDTQIANLIESLEQLKRAPNHQENRTPSQDIENGVIEETVKVTTVPELLSANIEPMQSKHDHMLDTIAQSSLSDNEKHLENVLQEKDKEIKLLKESNQSLTKLLGDKSHAVMGNTMLVDLHKLQMQVRTYEAERSQMMSVLNEKTRECSNQKNEVHRLVKTISAQKLALDKVQEDNKEIKRNSEEPQNDMQKQALQKLSRLIQDKDLEIEALKQKGDSLLQVLQSTTPNNSSDISRVLSENEEMQKENKMLKEERDQLVVSIHQKHHESLTYYEEVQRLVGVVNGETHKQAELQQKYNLIYADLDDKERSLSQLTVEVEHRDSSIAKFQKQLEERNQSVLDLENQLSNLNESLSKLDQQNQEGARASLGHQENEQLNALLRTKEEEITALKSQIDALRKTSQDSSKPAGIEGMVKAEVALVQMAPPQNEETFSVEVIEVAQLKEQLDVQAKSLSKKDSAIKSKDEELYHRMEELASLRQQVDLQNQSLLQRDAALQLKNHQLQTLTNDTKSKDVELHSLKSQNQTLHVQQQGFQSEIQTLKSDNQGLQHAVHNKDGENRTLQDMSNRLAVQIREKEFEIGALKEKNATLTRLVQEREVGTAGELQRLLGETEAMQKQALMFQQERDQALLALQRHQANLQAQQMEVHGSQEREQRLVREVERLRGHLIEVEEGYTREALQAEEREKELRNRLVQAEDSARTSSSAVHSASKEASSQIESLLDQLHSATNQKDQALLQLGEAQEQVEQYSTSLANLQLVLEQFTQEKEAEIAADIERYKFRADEKDKVAGQLFKQNVELQERLEATTEALDAASRLSEQLDRKEEVAVRLREELYKKEELLHQYEARFEEFGNARDSKVDKPLMKNLVLGYFHAPAKKRSEVLKLIGNVLNFSNDELQTVGVEENQGGWLSGIWGRGTPSSTPPSTPRKSKMENSFTEQFVKFLEHESTPTPKVRLPLEEMTSEKPRSPRGQLAFNPFSAPVPQYSPFMHHPEPRSGSGEPHQLMKPMLAPKSVLPAVPTIAPIVIGEAASGRSSPGSRSSGLSDILQ
ncbi:uncharacterized protein [Asterias amurensis]|uniref:uncharacterized protein n=1 Tax=Asterias amurensis TaxID=7602 RepID=UPI003AB6B5D7